MSNPPERPRFITNITYFQKTLAGIGGSMFLMALVSLIPFVENFFKPDFIYALSFIRAALAGTSLILSGWVGIPQIKYLVGYLFDIVEFYQKFSELKQKSKKE